MAHSRIIVVTVAALALLGIAFSARMSANAAQPDASSVCLLATGQMQPCVQAVDCVSFNAICNTSTGYCVCPPSSDASVVVDAGARDGTMFRPNEEAGTIGGVPPETGGSVGKPVGGCSYAGP